MPQKNQIDIHGFTLVELSIVIIIIGLIVGGVVVGRDLVRSAQVRATVSQYERFNTAAAAFKAKFGCLPGDCADPAAMGFALTSGGDGDGIIGPCDGMLVDPTVRCYEPVYYERASREYLNFWYHLSAAGMIGHNGTATASADTILGDPNFNMAGDPGPGTSVIPEIEHLSDKFGYPAGVVTPAAGITARGAGFGWAVRNGMRFAAPNTGNYTGVNPTVTVLAAHNLILGKSVVGLTMTRDPYQAFDPVDIAAVDRKLDDGLPLSGKMQVYESRYYATDGAHSQAFTDSGYGCGATPPATGARCACHDGGSPPSQWVYNERVTPASRLCSAAIRGTF
ncbi:MAG: prepilin-type N-terminal cleavage/methylation domain-containing protein [Planctomycetia bacterium]|nr:prepilin-type N-terminal cleavage/methylation domain-containing protein [Planctomycetia bacterium]